MQEIVEALAKNVNISIITGQISDMAIKDAERMSDEEWDFIYGAEVRRD